MRASAELIDGVAMFQHLLDSGKLGWHSPEIGRHVGDGLAFGVELLVRQRWSA